MDFHKKRTGKRVQRFLSTAKKQNVFFYRISIFILFTISCFSVVRVLCDVSKREKKIRLCRPKLFIEHTFFINRPSTEYLLKNSSSSKESSWGCCFKLLYLRGPFCHISSYQLKLFFQVQEYCDVSELPKETNTLLLQILLLFRSLFFPVWVCHIMMQQSYRLPFKVFTPPLFPNKTLKNYTVDK